MISSQKSVRSLLILILFFLTSGGFATETRVDGSGGLGLIFSDETQDLSPFMVGNPAGLALLDPQNRFDIAGQWFKQNDAATNSDTRIYGAMENSIVQGETSALSRTRVYGTLNELGPDSMKYHGLMLFPEKKWAVQIDGDFQHLDHQPGLTVQDQGLDRTRELFRTAYHFGAFVLGADIQAGQGSLSIPAGTFYGSELLSGTGTTSNLFANAGLLIPFPENPRPNQDRFLFGGVYSRQAIPSKDTEALSLNIMPSSTQATLTQTLTEDTAQSFGPDFYYQVPNAFEGCLLARVTNGSTSLQIDSSNTGLVPNITSFKLMDNNGFAILGVFKTTSLLFKTTSLKTGFAFQFGSGGTTFYDPSQTITQTQSVQDWKAQAGIGLEKLLDFTVGLQAEVGNVVGNAAPSGSAAIPIGLFSYKISLGGERWITKQFAFRGGLLFKSDQNNGAAPYPLLLYAVNNGQTVLSTTITAGAGFKESNIQTDFMFWFGQPYIYNSPNPNDFMTQIGFQLAASLLFN